MARRRATFILSGVNSIASRSCLPVLLACAFVLAECDSSEARPAVPCHDWRGRNFCDGPGRREPMRDYWNRSDLVLPPILPEELPEPESEGARLLAGYCMQCHNLVAPSMHSAADWPGVVERMRLRLEWMGARDTPGGLRVPTAREWKVMQAFLQEYAQKTLEPEALPEQATAAARLYRANCGGCHALPDPARHTARAWPAVVDRMAKYMSRAGQRTPDRRERESLLAYLRKHAAPAEKPDAKPASL